MLRTPLPRAQTVEIPAGQSSVRTDPEASAAGLRTDSRERELRALYRVVDAALRAESLDALYATTLGAVAEALAVDRAAVLLFDRAGRMRFRAWIGLSEAYRTAVDGHSPWTPTTSHARPVIVDEADTDPGLAAFREVFIEERIQSLAFIPLLHQDRVIGKFMLYSDHPGRFGPGEVELAATLAGTIAMAIVKKHQEEELRARQVRLDALFKALPVMLFEAETGSPLGASWISENVGALTGFPTTPFITEPGFWIGRVHPEDRAQVEAAFSRTCTGQPIELEYRWQMPDGTYRWFLERAYPVQALAEGRHRLVGVWMDITARKQAEEAIRASERSYRGLFDGVRDAIYIMDAQGRFLDVNRGAELMYGRARSEFIGLTPEPLSAPGQNDLAAVAASLRRAFEGEPQSFPFWGLRSSGEVFPKEVRLFPGTYFGEQVVIAIGQDVTERRKAEEALRQAQKMESLGLLAGGIAHDFNNLLTAIVGNLDLARMKLGEGSALGPYLDSACSAVEKASGLTKQMLAYSGRGRFLVKPLDLNSAVQDMVQLLRVTLPKGADLGLQLEPGLPAIEADLAQIQQVVMNLVTNASEALEGGDGRIQVRTCAEELDEAGLAGRFPAQDLRPGRFVALEVADTGCGISPEAQRRIFDPFFTTKDSGRGLGLSVLQGILRGHRGGIEIRSRPGAGSTFRILFPAVAVAAAAGVGRAPQPAREFSGRALLVDDEEIVLQSSGAMLEALGFEVVLARDGHEALDRFRSLDGSLRLVLMDLTMPRLDGRSAFLEMHRLDPGVPVVLSSGYDQTDSLATLGPEAPAGFIQKPYRLEELKAALALACGDPPDA